MTDFRTRQVGCQSDAGFRRTLISDQDYIANTPLEQRSILMSIPGMLLSKVWHDTMHGQNLGTAAYLGGNVMYDLHTFGVWGAESLPLNLRRAHMRFKAHVKPQGMTL